MIFVAAIFPGYLNTGRLLLFFFLLSGISQYSCSAQDQSTPLKSKLWVEGKCYYGFIIPHHENMLHLTNRHFNMFEISISEASSGDRLWEQLHKYPIKGISLLYTDLGDSPHLGKAIGVFPYLNFQLTKGEKINLFFRYSTGLGYITKPFSRTENYKNIAIGSHVNAMIQLLYEMRWKPAPRLEITVGASLTHFSNGVIKVPNLGINIASLNTGLAWKLNKNPNERRRNEIPEFDKKKWEFNVIAMGGISELYAAYGPKFPGFGITASFLKPVSLKRKIGIGLDITYNGANVESLIRLGMAPKNNVEVTRPGLAFTHKMEFSHLAIVMQLGSYMYTKFKKDGYIYDRIALQYTIKGHYIVHLGLKTHLFVADMVEYGIGYRF
jgi:hypothetical protein